MQTQSPNAEPAQQKRKPRKPPVSKRDARKAAPGSEKKSKRQAASNPEENPESKRQAVEKCFYQAVLPREAVLSVGEERGGSFWMVEPVTACFQSKDDWASLWPYCRIERVLGTAGEWTFTATSRCGLPAGRYYIGDPCYILNTEGALCNSVDTYKGVREGVHMRGGDTLFVARTAHGDGGWTVDELHFGVDTGAICIASESLIELPYDDSPGHCLSFARPITCLFQDGMFIFVSGEDSFVIDTRFDSDEDSSDIE